MIVKTLDEVKPYIIYLLLEQENVVAKAESKFLIGNESNEVSFGAPSKVLWTKKPGNSLYKIPIGHHYLVPLVDGDDFNDMSKLALSINKKEVLPEQLCRDFALDEARKLIASQQSKSEEEAVEQSSDIKGNAGGDIRKSMRKRATRDEVNEDEPANLPPKAKKQIINEMNARQINWDRIVKKIQGIRYSSSESDAEGNSDNEPAIIEPKLSVPKENDVATNNSNSPVTAAVPCTMCRSYQDEIKQLNNELALKTDFSAINSVITAAVAEVKETAAGVKETASDLKKTALELKKTAMELKTIIPVPHTGEPERSQGISLTNESDDRERSFSFTETPNQPAANHQQVLLQIQPNEASPSLDSAASNGSFDHSTFPVSSSVILGAPKQSVSRFVAHVMDAVYSVAYLKTHKMTKQDGRPGKTPKTTMNQAELQHLIEVTMNQNLKDKNGRPATIDDIRSAIGAKFNNASKEHKK